MAEDKKEVWNNLIVDFEEDGSFISIFKEHNKELYDEYKQKYTYSEDALEDILQFFIEGGIDIDVKDKDGKTALIYEVESMGRTSTYQTKKNKDAFVNILKKHIKRVHLLMTFGADVNAVDNDGQTALIWASKYGLDSIVDLLLEHNAKVDIQAKNDATALMWASLRNHISTVQSLLEHKADMNAVSNNGNSALMLACRENRKNVALKLLLYGADTSLQNVDGDTALILASKKNHISAVRSLLFYAKKIDIEKTNKFGKTALMEACGQEHREIIEILLEKGASINIADKKGDTPLLYALRRHDNAIIEFLIEKGADVNLANCYTGETPLMKIIDESPHPELRFSGDQEYLEVAQLLIENTTNANAKDFKGYTAYYYANSENKQFKELCSLLEERGAETDTVPNEDSTLMAAIKENDVDTAKKCLNDGINIHLQNKNGESALDYAIAKNNVEMVELLLENGAYGQKEDLLFQTIMENRDIEIIRLLIEYGTNVDGRYDNYNEQEEYENMITVPLYGAIVKGRYEVAELLLGKGAKKSYTVEYYDESEEDEEVKLQYVAVDYNNMEMVELLRNHTYNDKDNKVLHDPKRLAKKLKKFSAEKLKYTNHPIPIGLSYDLFIENIEKGWKEIEEEVKALSETLYVKINIILYEWSSESIKKDFQEGKFSSEKIRTLQHKLKKLIVVKPDEEDLDLIDRFEQVLSKLDLKINIDMEYLGEEPIDQKFFTDTEELESALSTILLDIDEHSSRSIDVTVKCDYIKDKRIIELKIIHCDANINSNTTPNDLKNTIKNNDGNFGTIFNQLINVCDWSVDAVCEKGKRYEIHYLPEKDYQSLDGESEDFTHILRFYL